MPIEDDIAALVVQESTLTLPSNSPEWVARRFLPGLGNVQIMGPEKFRQAWLEQIKAVQKIYK